MRVLVITGNHPRHKVFINSVEKCIQPAAYIITQREAMVPPPPEDLDEYLQYLWRLHFKKRDEAEEEHFSGRLDNQLNAPVLEVPAGELNDDYVVDWVLKYGRFDLALISGVEIIKDPLFGLLPDYRINLHLGHIPEHRGVMSPFFCHYMLKPHWVTCTYHVFDRLVDCGQVLHQVQPELVREDGLHDSASRAYVRACEDTELVLKAIKLRIENKLVPISDPSIPRKGKLFKKVDWNPAMLSVIYDLFGDRIIEYFLDERIPHSPWPKLIKLSIP